MGAWGCGVGTWGRGVGTWGHSVSRGQQRRGPPRCLSAWATPGAATDPLILNFSPANPGDQNARGFKPPLGGALLGRPWDADTEYSKRAWETNDNI